MIQQFNIEENLVKKATKSINKAWMLKDNKVFHLKSKNRLFAFVIYKNRRRGIKNSQFIKGIIFFFNVHGCI